jgi:alkylation response protein AidB-like acyl-CoA dehydrogenase
MDFHLNSEQKAFADAVAKFAEKELAPGALERAHSPEYPWAIAQKISAQGLLGITFSEKDGGMGGTLMDAVIAIQEVALHCPKSADVVQAGLDAAFESGEPIAVLLSQRLIGRKKWVAKP